MDALRRAFHDIAVGYTREILFERVVYIKHLSYGDQIENDAQREQYHAEAEKQGLYTSEQKLKVLASEGAWTDKQERELAAIKAYTADLIEGKRKHVKMPSMVASYNDKIKVEEASYQTRFAAKQRLLGLTCDTYADRQLNDYYIYTNLFADKTLTTPFFTEGEFDYLSEDEIGVVTETYNRGVDLCSEANMKKLAIQAFFQNYFGLVGDNLGQFFGKPICSLTFFQVRLLSLAAHFRHIYSSNDVSKFPPNVRDDPDLLTDYAAAAKKGKEELEKQGAYDEDAIVVGGKKEDTDVLGVKTSPNLAAQIAQGGGNVIEWMRNKR